MQGYLCHGWRYRVAAVAPTRSGWGYVVDVVPLDDPPYRTLVAVDAWAAAVVAGRLPPALPLDTTIMRISYLTASLPDATRAALGLAQRP